MAAVGTPMTPGPAPDMAQTRFIDSLKKGAFILGSALIVLTAARNSITWHIQKFWGASGDFWVRLWDYVYYGLCGGNSYNIFVFGTLAFTFSVFWLFNALLMVTYMTGSPEWLMKYKIQPDVPAKTSPKRLLKVVLVVLFNQFVIGFLLTHLGYYVLTWRGCSLEPSEMPTFQWVIFEVFIYTLVEEALFYYSHRMLHHPLLYKRIHKMHHEWTTPISITSIYAHPVEYFFSNLLPVLCGPLLMGSHLAATWLWFAIALMSTSVSHCGFHIPFFPSPEAHDFHHLKFTNCFGVLGVLDRLHGTDRAFRATKAYDRHFMMLSLVPVRDLYPDTKGKRGE